MKTCPKCYKTYDDSWKVCLHDSAVLVDGGLKVNGPRLSEDAPPKKSPLLKMGLILFPIGLVGNIILMKLQIHGIGRELTRLCTLVGLFLIIFGGIYNLFKKRA